MSTVISGIPGGRPGPPSRPASHEEAVAALYAAHRLALVRLAVLLVDRQAVAEEVVQDAFAGLLARGRLRDPDAALGYLRRAVVNRSRSVLRRRRSARAFVAPVDRGADDPSAGLVVADEHREVLSALETLPPRQREVLVLRYWSDLSEAEIAATLGISAGTVKSTASRALRALEAALDPSDVPEFTEEQR